MFDSLGVKGAMLDSSTQQVYKGKEKVIEPKIDDEEGKHETEHEFQLIYLGEENEEKITNVALKGKEAWFERVKQHLE